MQSHAGHFAAFDPEKEDLEAGRSAEAGKLHPLVHAHKAMRFKAATSGAAVSYALNRG
jgi:hypothetical protein